MMTIRKAVPADLKTVVQILRSVAEWLHSRGYDQWPDGSPSLGPAKIGDQIARGDFWLVHSGNDPVAVIAISADGDPDFWTVEELSESAVYISKAAVVRRKAGQGIGALLLRWACDWAAANGVRWVRLDAWKTNQDLHIYYQRQGWAYLRVVQAPGRNSGALFQHAAAPDPQARGAFSLRSAPPQAGRISSPILAGSQVIAESDDGPVSARVTQVSADWSHGITTAGWEHGEGGPPLMYRLERDGQTWVAPAWTVWPDPDHEHARA